MLLIHEFGYILIFMKKILCLFSLIMFTMVSVFGQVFQAEDCKLSGPKVETTLDGYTGPGYISFSKYIQNYISFDFNIPVSGEYALVLKVQNSVDDKITSVKVIYDGKKYVCTQKIPVLNEFTEIYVNTPLLLDEGDHTVFIYGPNGGWNLDSIRIEQVTEKVRETYLSPSKLVTENPSPETQRLYDYLCKMERKGILSGQQMDKGITEVRVIENVTGKSPAVLGIDLIEFSPTRVERGATTRVIGEAKKWWDAGGIITCCWHWNAPMDLIDQGPDKYWYSGFYTRATTYNFATALNDENSEEYKTMIRDIDAIAVQLKVLQDYGIPILWRPLHEASGGWFWWGTKGDENYNRLYRLLFDRLQNYHKLNNLIWVWNGQNPQWYPGDEYVDIISYDSYPGKHKHTTVQSDLEKIQSATSMRKLAAISENGALPDVSKLSESNIPWSWFCTWSGDFAVKNRAYSSEYTDQEVFVNYYNDEYMITRDELPNFKE